MSIGSDTTAGQRRLFIFYDEAVAAKYSSPGLATEIQLSTLSGTPSPLVPARVISATKKTRKGSVRANCVSREIKDVSVTKKSFISGRNRSDQNPTDLADRPHRHRHQINLGYRHRPCLKIASAHGRRKLPTKVGRKI